MKYLGLEILIIGLIVFGFNQKSQSNDSRTNKISTEVLSDKEQIRNLIRQVLYWHDNSFEVLPVLNDSKNNIYVFDLKQLKINLDNLRETNFFAEEFIENYNQIILTLDRKLRNKEFHEWQVGTLPTFIFANDVDPWCLCQDVPYDNPNPWDLVEVEIINLNSKRGVLDWKWGNPELNGAAGWKEFRYSFEVIKENGKWKIAYMQGFDFNESTRKDGLY
jgi:hypothetical protein